MGNGLSLIHASCRPFSIARGNVNPDRRANVRHGRLTMLSRTRKRMAMWMGRSSPRSPRGYRLGTGCCGPQWFVWQKASKEEIQL